MNTKVSVFAIFVILLACPTTLNAQTSTPGTFPVFTDNVGAVADSIISQDPTTKRIKVGTSTQSGAVHIFSPATSDAWLAMGVLPDYGSGQPSFNFGYAGASFGRSAGFINVRPDALATGVNPSLRFMTADVQRMIITKDGRVGIGELNPSVDLHVKNASTFAQLTIEGAATASDTGLRIKGDREWKIGSNVGGTGEGKLTVYDISSGASRMVIDTAGNVGIGTAAPRVRLHAHSAATADVHAGFGPGPGVGEGPALSVGYAGSSFGRGAGFLNARPDAEAVAPNPSLRFGTANVQRMIITNTGAVGIGTSLPTAGYTLDVIGHGRFDGDLTVNGNLAAKYQDVAEWVPATAKMAPGTVAILNPAKTNEVMPSTTAYDMRVAGVVSAQPGLILGEASATKEMIATTGRVKVKVDARRAPIVVGDLLVTSDMPGMAMKSEPIEISGRKFHQPGTLIGKALEPLVDGQGEILVLLSLQ